MEPLKRESASARTAVVIGGVNMDIGACPAEKPVMRDSNPGIITVKPGGVGRNIAHNLALLGADVSLIAAIGDDFYSHGIQDSCRAIGIDTSMLLTVPGMRSSTYLYVTDDAGDMFIGVSDMDIVKCITPAFLATKLEHINAADAVVIDANLSAEAIAYLAGHCTAPLYADPVSTVKAVRLLPILGSLTCIKPNLLEAQALTGKETPPECADALLEAGVKRVFISLGAEGILAAEGCERITVPAVPTRIINTTGAGDATTAAIVHAGMLGRGLAESAGYAALAGSLTAACSETNSPELKNIRI